MARLGINTGIGPNDGTGDSLRVAGGKINSNFDDIYNYFGDGTNLTFTSVNWDKTTVGVNTLSNVGIGTTNPIKTLTVYGDSRFTGNVTITGLVTATSFTGSLIGNASSSDYAGSAGISTISSYAIISGLSTYATSAGFATDSTTSVNVIGGVSSVTSLFSSGITTLASSGGITTTGGALYVGGDLFVLDDITYDEVNVSRNLNVTGISTFNVISAGGSVTSSDKFYGDGSQLTGITGFATALSSDNASPLNAFFKTPKVINVGSGISITVESDETSGNIAFVREKIIIVASGATMRIGSGTTVLMNVLDIF